jgi:excisionase family DNA binding protein
MTKTIADSDASQNVRRTRSVEEAAQILGISRASAYAYAKSGDLPTIRMGNRLLVPEAALEKLLASA